jgi:[citrate (pro-3S)-lyase] ligase
VNANENAFLGQFMSLCERGFSPFEKLYESGIEKVHIYCDGNKALLLTNYLGERRDSFGIITRDAGFVNIVFGWRLQTVALASALVSKYAESEALVVTGNDLTKSELDALKKVFGNRVYPFEDALTYVIKKYGFILPFNKVIAEKGLHVSVFAINGFSVGGIVNKSEYEKLLISPYEKLTAEQKEYINKTKKGTVLAGYTDEHYRCLKNQPVFYRKGGVVYAKDYTSEYMVIKDSTRRTIDVPENAENTIWTIGNSRVFALGVIDADTFQSKLQQILNTSEYNGKYAVKNIPRGGGYSVAMFFPFINELPIKSGDIIIIGSSFDFSQFLNIINLSKTVQRPHDMGEIFLDGIHVNGAGNKAIAKTIFEHLKERGAFDGTDNYSPDIEKSNNDDAQLAEYKSFLTALRVPVGAVVMNCNPFTFGHLHLVETAAAKVERLFLFVVEEDKSQFPFKDRIALVRRGTEHIPNVTVLPGGRFIISAGTFGIYFEKSEKQDVVIDATGDVLIFAREIAPALGITVRFAGEEPLDNVTRQYNETMRRILPRHGVEFVEIPRREASGEPISASRVRKLLETKDFDGIRELVPETTFEYLQKLAGDSVY